MGKAPLELGTRGNAMVTSVACHPSQDVVAVGYDDGMVMAVRFADAKEVLLRRQGKGAITSMMWDKEERRIAFGSAAGDCGVIDINCVAPRASCYLGAAGDFVAGEIDRLAVAVLVGRAVIATASVYTPVIERPPSSLAFGQDRQFDRAEPLGHLLFVIDVQPQFLGVEPVLGEVGILEHRLAQIVADGSSPQNFPRSPRKLLVGLPRPLVTPASSWNLHRRIIGGTPDAAGGESRAGRRKDQHGRADDRPHVLPPRVP